MKGATQMTLPEYLLYKKRYKKNEIVIRRLKYTHEAGVRIEQEFSDSPFSRSAEFFINKEDAKEIIKALQKYFRI